MFYLTLFIFVLVGLAIAGIVLIGFPWLAGGNILFTKVAEGTVKAIMRGGSLDRFVMSFEEYHLNDPSKPWYDPDHHDDWEVVFHGKGNDGKYDDRAWWLERLGLYWVGWPWANGVHVYEFQWNEPYTDGTTGKQRVLPRAEATDFVYVADFTYAIVTDEAETEDRLKTDEVTYTTVAIRNPYRALFSGEDWMRRVTSAVNRHVREFVGKRDFKSLLAAKNATEFSAPIILLTTELPDDAPGIESRGLRGRYGVEIRTADLQTIELSGDAKKKNEEATTKQYMAEQEAQAQRTIGQAQADVIKMRGDTEAEALRARLAVIKEHGEAGITLAGYDAIQESSKGPGNTIIWANSPLGALGAAASGLLKPEKQNKGDEK